MGPISTCPNCDRPVALPVAEPIVRVRCPLCRSEFMMQEVMTSAPPMLEVLSASAESDFDSWGTTEKPAQPLSSAVAGDELNELESSADLNFEPDLGPEPDAPMDETKNSGELIFEDFTASEVSEISFAPAEEAEEADTELEGKPPTVEAEPVSETLIFEEPAIAFEEQALDFEKPAEDSSDSFEMELDFGEPKPETERVEGEMIDFSDVNPDEPGYALEEPVGLETARQPAVSQNPFAEMEGASNISAASSAVKRKKKESSFLGSLVGIVGGGVIAVPLALFVVLWIRGPEGDIAGMGQYLPSWMLPAAFNEPKSSASAPLAMSPTPTPQDLEEVRQAGNLEPSQLEPPAVLSEDEEGEEKPAQISDPDATSADPFGKPLPFAEGGEEALPMKESETAADLAADLASDDLASDLAAPTISLPSASEIPAKQPADVAPATQPADATESPAKEVPANEPSFEDDIFAPEPTETPAKPEPAAKSDSREVGLKNPPTYTAEQLSTTVKEVIDARTALSQAEGANAKSLRGEYYKKMYRLGELAAFAADAELEKGEVAALLQETSADVNQQKEMNLYADQWIRRTAEQRGDDKGILISGKVEEIAEKDGMFRVRLLTVGKEFPISVYSLKEPDLVVGDIAVVLGSIVVNPQEAMHQFSEETAPVVWQGLSLKAGK